MKYELVEDRLTGTLEEMEVEDEDSETVRETELGIVDAFDYSFDCSKRIIYGFFHPCSGDYETRVRSTGEDE